MFAGILLKTFWYLYKINNENENRVQPVYVGTKSRVYLYKDLPVKTLYLQQIFIIFKRVQISKM